MSIVKYLILLLTLILVPIGKAEVTSEITIDGVLSSESIAAFSHGFGVNWVTGLSLNSKKISLKEAKLHIKFQRKLSSSHQLKIIFDTKYREDHVFRLCSLETKKCENLSFLPEHPTLGVRVTQNKQPLFNVKFKAGICEKEESCVFDIAPWKLVQLSQGNRNQNWDKILIAQISQDKIYIKNSINKKTLAYFEHELNLQNKTIRRIEVLENGILGVLFSGGYLEINIVENSATWVDSEGVFHWNNLLKLSKSTSSIIDINTEHEIGPFIYGNHNYFFWDNGFLKREIGSQFQLYAFKSKAIQVVEGNSKINVIYKDDKHLYYSVMDKVSSDFLNTNKYLPIWNFQELKSIYHTIYGPVQFTGKGIYLLGEKEFTQGSLSVSSSGFKALGNGIVAMQKNSLWNFFKQSELQKRSFTPLRKNLKCKDKIFAHSGNSSTVITCRDSQGIYLVFSK